MAEQTYIVGKDDKGELQALGVVNDGLQVSGASNDIGRTAWGIPKTSLDFSLFSGMWTFDVPKRLWIQNNDTGAGFSELSQPDNNLVKSLNGQLFVSSNATTDVRLSSKRHIRYQPNRGLTFSTALVLPTPTAVGERRFGLKTNGSNAMVFSLLGNGTTWALRLIKTTTVNGVISEIVKDITNQLPANFDPSKGNTYDIQMQWRGFGNFCFFINLSRVYIMDMLETLTDVSISNPALSVTFESVNFTALSGGIKVGCVDVTSEGGGTENKIPNSVSTKKTLLTTNNTGVAILAIKIPTNITYNGFSEPYTRDVILSKLHTFCKDEAFRSVHIARSLDVSNLDTLVWIDATDSYYQTINNTDGTLNTAFQSDKANMEEIYSIRAEKDISKILDFEPFGDAPRYLTGGDILVVELKSDGNSTGGCTLDFLEEM